MNTIYCVGTQDTINNISKMADNETDVPPISNEDKRRQEIAKQLKREVLHYQNVFEVRGLLFLGKEKGAGSKKVLDRRFRSTYGTSSIVVCRIWQLLQRDATSLKGMTVDHLLWGLILLKVYAFESIHAGMTGVDEKTFRKWSHFAIRSVADMHEDVVSYILYVLSNMFYAKLLNNASL